MKKRLIITDVSRMRGSRICIFGIEGNIKGIRPVIPYSGITEDYLLDEKGDISIMPFAEIEFDLICPVPKPPHTEDWKINVRYKPKLIRNLTEDEGKKFLGSIIDKSVKDIFGVTIYENQYIKEVRGKRSLGTIKVKEVLFIKYSQKENGKYTYRIKFLDADGEIYDLPITDLAFRKYCDELRTQKELSTGFIGAELQRLFNRADIFLRVGLGRFFKDKHWLFVTGIYTFPEYSKSSKF